MPVHAILDGRITSGQVAEALTRGGYKARVNYGDADGFGCVLWDDKIGTGGGNLMVYHPAGDGLGSHTELDMGWKGEAPEAFAHLVREFGGLCLRDDPEPWEGDRATRNRLMRGGCYAFALFLHERTGLPLCVLKDSFGISHHAAVIDIEAAMVVDARGDIMASRARYVDGEPGYGFKVALADRDEIEQLATGSAERGISPTEDEMQAFAETVPALRDRLAAAAPASAAP